MNRKPLAIIIFVVIALTPLILISQQYRGFNNIPHYDITMWIFMLNYILLFTIIGFAVLIFVTKDDTPKYPQPERIRKPLPVKKVVSKKKPTKKLIEKPTKEPIKQEEPKDETKPKKEKKKLTPEQDMERLEWAKLYKEARKTK